MLKSLHTIKLIGAYLREKGVLKQEIISIEDIYQFFIYLKQNPNSFYTLYIYNYLFHFISSDEVAKRKTSARVFEDLLANIFDAEVADNQKRSNLEFCVGDYFINVKDKIASNCREKADIIFANHYAFSVKTLIAKNAEINMGSFEKRVLFDGLRVDNYLSERKSSEGAGVGSKPQFLKLLKLIETLSSYEIFVEKFNKMAEFIYDNDLLLTIKNNEKMELYFFAGSEIVALFKTMSKDKENFLSIVNRYEGNSLRIDRNALIKACKRSALLDFSHLNHSVMNLINQFDYKLHKSYVEYFKDKNSKNELFEDLEALFDYFDTHFKELN
ncbi:hypothetical protein PO136_000432 [Campylobacter upsaliensis]|nr:hypothetical protein [Campylobacter upsaliensis]